MIMQKKDICNIPIRTYESDRWYSKEDLPYYWIATIQIERIKGIIIMVLNLYKRQELFDQAILSPHYRIFINRKEKKFETQDFTETKQYWTLKTLEKIATYEYEPLSLFNRHTMVMINESDKKLLDIYLKQYKGNWKERIYLFQREVLLKEILDKNPSISLAEKYMYAINRPLPRDFDKWIQTDALYKSRYIYYDYVKKAKRVLGYCTHCKQDVYVDKPKHRKEGICPVCSSKITYLCKSKAKYIIYRVYATVLYKINDGISLKKMLITKNYVNDFKTPSLNYEEQERICILNNGIIERYSYGYNEVTSDRRWSEGDPYYASIKKTVLYSKNVKEIFEQTSFCYSGIGELVKANGGEEFYVEEYLRNYRSYPKLENLAKAGLMNILNYVVTHNLQGINFEKNKLHEMMGISREDIRYIQDIKGSHEDWNFIKKCRENNIKISYEQLDKLRTLIKLNENIFDIWKLTTVHKSIRYLMEQAKGKKKERYNTTLILWKDYIRNGKDIGYDLKNEFVLFPKHLQEAHDYVSDEVIHKKEEIQNKHMIDIYETLKQQYEFENKTYFIKIPESTAEIVKEGQALHHCVGSYAHRMAKGETIILFIRKKENPCEPFFTMEIKNGKVAQYHGEYNDAHRKIPQSIKKFVESFKKECLQIIENKTA